MNTAVDSFENQIAGFNVELLGHVVLEQAELFIKKYGKTYELKALDALHLGAFSLISEKDWSFVVADGGVLYVLGNA